MYKKIILASAIMASTVGIAAADPAPYVGASVGVTNNYLNAETTAMNVNFAGFRGVPFSLFAGYGGVVTQSFFLAGEITGTLATAELSGNNGLKTTWGYGASILPGVMINDSTVAFLRGGAVRTHFSSNENRTGGIFGLGLQTSLTQNIDVRGEYDFVAYQSINQTLPAGGKLSISPRADQATLSLVYKID